MSKVPFDMTSEALDAILRANHAQTGIPTFYGRAMIVAAKRAGLDTDALLRDGVIAPYAAIPMAGADNRVYRPTGRLMDDYRAREAKGSAE